MTEERVWHTHKGVVGHHLITQQHKNFNAQKAHNAEVKKYEINTSYGEKLVEKTPIKVTKELIRQVGVSNINDTPLGTKMKDKVTGFEGIAVAKVVFLNGCVQFSLKPDKLDKEGKTMESVTIDSHQLEVVGPGLNKEIKPKEKPTGGDMPDSPLIPDY